MVILAAIEGAVTMVGRHHADPLIANKVEAARLACSHATRNWPIFQDGMVLREEASKQLMEIHGKMDAIWWLRAKPTMNYPGMCYLAIEMAIDLMQLIANPQRQGWLEDIVDKIKVLVDYVDPDGEMLLTQDRALEIKRAIYSVVGEE